MNEFLDSFPDVALEPAPRPGLWARIRSAFQPAPTPQAPETPKALKVGVSISRKINLGNYESADVWVSLSGLDARTTAEDIQAALATGALGYDALKVAVTAKAKDVRATMGERMYSNNGK